MRRLTVFLCSVAALALSVLLAAVTCNGGRPTRDATDSGDAAPSPADTSRIDTARRRRRARTNPAADAVTAAARPPGETPAAPPVTVDWTVRCVDPDGRAVSGLTLDLREPSAASVRSDAEGIARFTTAAGVDQVALHCEGLAEKAVTLTLRDSTLTTLPTVPLRARIVDGETGAPVRGARAFLVLDDGERVPLASPVDGGCASTAPVFATRTTWMRIAVDAPSGHAAESGVGTYFKVPVSRYATGVSVPIALRREADVVITVHEPDGSPARGATVRSVRVGDEWVGGGTSEPADAEGVVRVRGVPFLRRHELRVVVGKDGRDAQVTGLRFGAAPAPLSADVTLPAEKHDEISIGGGAGGRFGGSSHMGPRIREGEARLEVTVRRRDGRLAPQARVLLNGQREIRADAGGRVVFDRLAQGGYTLTLDEAGLTWTRQVCQVGATDVTSSELIEGPGRSVTLTVSDADGVPLPGATVRLGRLGREGDVQLLDGDEQPLHFLSGPDGAVRLEHVPEMRLFVEARYGSWQGRAELQQDRAEVTIVVGPK